MRPAAAADAACDNPPPLHRARRVLPRMPAKPSTRAKTRKPRPFAVRHSPIHGRGVFATRTIRKGADIVEYRGKRISMEAADELPDSDPNNPYHTFLFELNDGRVIDAGRGGNAARWINPVSYTHLRAHETPEHLVCRLLL